MCAVAAIRSNPHLGDLAERECPGRSPSFDHRLDVALLHTLVVGY
jgi:hypothetical protein